MFKQTFVKIKSDTYKTPKKTVLKKFPWVLKVNDKRRNSILLKILDQIQQNNADARDGINKSAATICNEESISLKQVFYILFFFMLSLSAINHTLVYILIIF